MRINPTSENSFKGYDARKLKALCIGTTRYQLGRELAKIGENVGFEVFIPTLSGLQKINSVNRDIHLGHKLWLQDLVTTTPKNSVIPVFSAEMLARFISRHFNKDLDRSSSQIPAGGNMFFVKNNKTGKEDLLLGANDAHSLSENPSLKELLGVDNIDVVPQMDFHIDMFLRPLENKTVLLADDSLTLRVLRVGLSRINAALSKPENNKRALKNVYNNLANNLREFREEVNKNSGIKVDSVEKRLQQYGYNVIKVPGRIYSFDSQDSLRCTTNFMNAIVTKNDKNELVYITNKSFLDEKCGITPEIKNQIDFSFEDEFLKSIMAYIKPENVHFISGEGRYLESLLEDSFGGLHCITTEIL